MKIAKFLEKPSLTLYCIFFYYSKDEEIVSEGSEASDRSPSPPPQKSRKKSVRKVKTRNSSGSAADEIEKLGAVI